MSGFVETQMDDADRAGVDYSLATACAPCEGGDHHNCKFWGCPCYLRPEHKESVRSRWPKVRPVLRIADLAPEDGPAADPEYAGSLGTWDRHRHEDELAERVGLSQAALPLTAAERRKLGMEEL